MIRYLFVMIALLLCCAITLPAGADEGNRQRPPLAATSGECHIVDTQPLFSEATVGETYVRREVETRPLTWMESFRSSRPEATVTIYHRGCEDISSTIRVHFSGPSLAKDDLLRNAIELLKSLDPKPAGGPVPFNLKEIVRWLGGDEAAGARRLDHTACFHRIENECIEDAYFTSPGPNVLVITSVDRP
jgi:hypothetical protein